MNPPRKFSETFRNFPDEFPGFDGGDPDYTHATGLSVEGSPKLLESRIKHLLFLQQILKIELPG
jgi:hypothetical protein